MRFGGKSQCCNRQGGWWREQFLLSQHWPQRLSLCNSDDLSFVSPHSSLAEHRCVYTSWELLVCLLWPQTCTTTELYCTETHPAHPPLPDSVGIYGAEMQQCSLDLLLSKDWSENTQWILLAGSSLQSSGNKWQHRTRDCTKVAFQRGKEEEAPQESAQAQCQYWGQYWEDIHLHTRVRNQAWRNRLIPHSAQLFSHQSNN